MRIFMIVILFCLTINAQKRFNPDYFVQKYNLKLPNVTTKMLNVAEQTHKSDTWKYYYQGKTEKLDSVVRKMTIEGFPRNLQKDNYNYSDDTVYVSSISIWIDSGGDTSAIRHYKYVNNFKTQISYNPKTNCIWKSKFDERGIKMLDVNKCSGDTEFSGQVFHLYVRDKYLEKYKEKNSKIDSNSIRRYYLAPFDSIVADFMVKKDKDPYIVFLNKYNKSNKKEFRFTFERPPNNNDVSNFIYNTYTKDHKLYRVYNFWVKDRKAKVKEFRLVNYTEYEYDSLGRKIKMTTRVKPDKKD